MPAPISLSLLPGSAVQIRPKSYLGGDLFKRYQQAVEGAKFDGATKSYIAPLAVLPGIISRLKVEGFAPSGSAELHAAVNRIYLESLAHTQKAQEQADKVHASLQARGLSLYPFQRQGVTWLSGVGDRLLSDEMGLGKTIEALAAITTPAALVVCPAVAKGVWEAECKKWRPDLVPFQMQGRNGFRWPEEGELGIVNYDILPPSLEGSGWQGDEPCPCPMTLIPDECHALKNYKAARTKNFRFLADEVKRKGGRTIGLTATPLLNRPPELWGVLQSLGLAHSAFGSFRQFRELYQCTRGEYAIEWGQPLPEVAPRLERVMLRRLRAEVLPELPVKVWQKLSCDLDRDTLDACFDALEGTDGPDTLQECEDIEALPSFTKISKARALLAQAKIPALLSLLESFDSAGESLVVFSAHRAPVDALTQKGFSAITGDTSSSERVRLQDAFQCGAVRRMACTIQAAGTALTLTRAHQAIFVDRLFTPALNAQGEDRLCRIGQTRGVVITDLVGNHILDERLYEVLMRKQRLIEGTMRV
jgi:SWI/SNF-related matrix-associated actin-dependent regulator 1 of chromatin subfamily A